MRAGAIVVLLALCGVTILAMVREQTGTDGFLIGLLLSTLPVPLLIAAFRWVGNVQPPPWRTIAFTFAWGACAATLVAIIANSFTAAWLSTSVMPDRDADVVGATLVAPVVEELAKAVAVLLVFLHRRRFFGGVVDGVVTACVTATGFAFTENILYLGTAYATDQLHTGDGYETATTLQTFLMRIVFSPFAHPLFTALTGIGFGIAAAVPARRRVLRVALPLSGLLTAIVLHALWNAAATSRSGLTFLAIYALFMLPVLATLIWLTVWSRGRELRTIRDTLHVYAAQGWVHPAEPWTLGSMRARSQARALARRVHGKPAARSVAAYHAAATALALLRARAERTAPPPDFPTRERALLTTLLTHRPTASPPTTTVAPVPHLWHGCWHWRA